MNLTQFKVVIVGLLPARLIMPLIRFYGSALRALTELARHSSANWALYLRIANRRKLPNDLDLLKQPRFRNLQVWDKSFDFYEGDRRDGVRLAWVHKPVSGNFGDWLSPYVLHHASCAPVIHEDLASARRVPHVLSIGSIIGYANEHSTVLGSGINSLRDEVSPNAKYPMVRGHFTLEKLPPNARRRDIVCCDPGFFIREIYQPRCKRADHSYRLLVPHINHTVAFSALRDHEFVLASAAVSHPKDIEALIDSIAFADEVVTSAMHIFVVACAYGVPCALIKPSETTQRVPGDGIKYRDCMSPVLAGDFRPQSLHLSEKTRLDEEVVVQKYDLDFSHIQASYRAYRALVDDLL